MSVLVLAGTGEARRLLAEAKGLAVTASLAGATRKPKPLGVPTRSGGFGGLEGFKAYLTEHGITAVLDMTHPYAARMPHTAAQACAEMARPYLRFLRAPWVPTKADQWVDIDTFDDAADLIPHDASIFLGTGGQTVADAEPLYDRTLWLRRVDKGGIAPWEKGGYIIGPPGDTVAKEKHLFRKYKITHLICKNSGGDQGASKLTAARDLKIPVFMLRRPMSPQAPTTDDMDCALDWLKSHG